MQQSVSEVAKALEDVKQVQALAKDWWEEPAQMLVPDVQVGGKNLAQWR